MTNAAKQDSKLSQHMREAHGQTPDQWKQYENHSYQENWHTMIHQHVDTKNEYMPNGLRTFMPVDHWHSLDEYVEFMVP